MVHNGFNTYSKENLGLIQIGKYTCPNCQSNQEESKYIWTDLLSQIKDFFALFASKCRDQNVSYEGIAEISKFLIPHGKDYFAELFGVINMREISSKPPQENHKIAPRFS